jgi:integrase
MFTVSGARHRQKTTMARCISMAKRKQLSVSWHEPSGQFTKWVGMTLGKDGEPKPKCFYLGDDETAAVVKAGSLRNEWKSLKAQGIDSWPEQVAKPVRESEQTAVPTNMSVGDASTEYLSIIKAEADAQQITYQHYEATRYRVARVVSFLGSKQTLRSIGEREIKQFVLTVATRPNVATYNGKRHPMSISYSRRIIGEARVFLDWANRQGYWPNRPSVFERLFRFKIVRTTAERAAQFSNGLVEPPSFTIEQLTDLYEVSCERHRLWILLALNCGFSQAELDSLRRFEVIGLSGESPRIERYRRKTEVYARWTLWPETAVLLSKHIASPNEEDIALFTAHGGRLKCVCQSGVFSGVSEAWRKIRGRSGVSGSFKLLRKTGAWMTKRIGGLEVSEMYLSHSEPGMNKHYAGRPWDKLDAALVEMRRQLQPMFDSTKKAGAVRFRKRANKADSRRSV